MKSKLQGAWLALGFGLLELVLELRGRLLSTVLLSEVVGGVANLLDTLIDTATKMIVEGQVAGGLLEAETQVLMLFG